MPTYEPAEDSYLLHKYVKEQAFGRVLDMGTGSGIQALTAAASPNVREVVAVDIDPEAVEQLQKAVTKNKLTSKKIKALQSDLFENVAGQFDTIIFNPPYLPQDKNVEDRAIYGGKKGWELIERFFSNAARYLASKGKLLLLFSSLTNKNKVEEIIAHHLFSFQELGREKQAFEELYAYLAEKSPILRDMERHGVENIHYFTHGKRGDIFIGLFNRTTLVKTHFPEKQLVKVAIKVQRRETQATGSIANEAHWLQKLNPEGIGPRLLFSSDKYIVYAFVEGEFLEDWLRQQTAKKAILAVLKAILEQCYQLDKLGITKEELHHPLKHILIDSLQQPVLLDFERTRETKKPQNVTQFVEYLCRLEALLRQKSILFSKKELRQAAKIYKSSLSRASSEPAFQQLVSLMR